MAKLKLSTPLTGEREPIFSIRFMIAVAFMVLGIAWLAYYYLGVHPKDHQYTHTLAQFRGLKPLRHLKDWNYLVGFGLFFLGLIVSAHPSTPLGRNRGVVIAMVGSWILGLVWICIYYIFSGAGYWHKIPVFNDLDQKNLIVGIAWLAVGFAFATRWE